MGANRKLPGAPPGARSPRGRARRGAPRGPAAPGSDLQIAAAERDAGDSAERGGRGRAGGIICPALSTRVLRGCLGTGAAASGLVASPSTPRQVGPVYREAWTREAENRVPRWTAVLRGGDAARCAGPGPGDAPASGVPRPR